VSLICIGGGSVAGAPMFKKCSFAQDYASLNGPKVLEKMNRFLQGKIEVTFPEAAMILGGIVYGRLLNDDSACFTGTGNCMEEVSGLPAKTPNFKENFMGVFEEMKGYGIKDS